MKSLFFRGCVNCANELRFPWESRVANGAGYKRQVIILKVIFSDAESTRGHPFSKDAQPGEEGDFIRDFSQPLGLYFL